ncbi:hypothetical protein VaNZ11_009798 [Volvox africanus]|uniref:GATA-type domain-containing protein n=1 Tax=Volvox africanus TaxID=51714 RepID=A0ABQ5S9H8_9CHLO|nr:hypothetical protein VaNZ11_009798 [Volvox africanus]
MESFLIAESCPLPIDELKFILPIDDEELVCMAVADVGEFFPSRKRQAVGDSDEGGPVSSVEPSNCYAQYLWLSHIPSKRSMPDYGPTRGAHSGGCLVAQPAPTVVQTAQLIQAQPPMPSQNYIPDCRLSAFCVRGHQLNVMESMHLTPQPAAGVYGSSSNGVLPQSSCGRGSSQPHSKSMMQNEVPMAPATVDWPEVMPATEAPVPSNAASIIIPSGEAGVTDSPLLAPHAAATNPLDQQQRRLVGFAAPASSSVCRQGSVCGEDTEDGGDGVDGDSDEKVNAVTGSDTTTICSKRQSSGCPSPATGSWKDLAVSVVADEASDAQAISPEPAALEVHAEHEVCSLGAQPARSHYAQTASVRKASNTDSAATRSTSSPPVPDQQRCLEDASMATRRRRISALAGANEHEDFEPVTKRPRRMRPLATVDDEDMDVDTITSNAGGDDKDDEDYVMGQRCPGNLKRAHIALSRKVKMPTAKGSDATICRECGTDKTPQWRCGPEGPRTLCNACGVRYTKSLGKARPVLGRRQR